MLGKSCGEGKKRRAFFTMKNMKDMKKGRKGDFYKSTRERGGWLMIHQPRVKTTWLGKDLTG